MATLDQAVRGFLEQKRIAVVGVSRRSDQAANVVFRKLRGAGYEVSPVNPNTEKAEGATCYPALAAIPGGVDAVFVATHPRVSGDVVRECVALGIPRVWLHRSIGQGSVSEEAVRIGREGKLTIIPGGCPAMFCEPVDVAHRCMRWFLGWTGRLPKST